MVGHKYTSEEHEFLRNFIPGHTYIEIVKAYNERFEDQITVSRIKGYMANHKINNGLTGRFKKGQVPHNKGKHTPTVGRMAQTQYKKGNLPHNTKPIGYERITKDGYIEVKTEMRPSPGKKNFIAKHRLVWEKVNGPVPKGYNIQFLDGNKMNCNIDNLVLVSKAENLEMTRQKLRYSNAELTKTGLLIAKATILSKNKKRSDNNAENI